MEKDKEKEIEKEEAEGLMRAIDLDSPSHFIETIRKMISKSEGIPEDELKLEFDPEAFSGEGLCKTCVDTIETCPNEDLRDSGATTCFYCIYYQKRRGNDK